MSLTIVRFRERNSKVNSTDLVLLVEGMLAADII
jgi:hypothetical protein